MKNRKNRKRKLNNKGLTLIEILIAMTLLTIAIVPMMRGFIQVNRYGEKGRSLQQCTTIAQTAMENCKAYNIADIHKQMTTGSFYDSSALYMVGAQYRNNGVGEYFISDMTVDGRNVGMSIKLNPIMSTKQSLTKYENCNERLDGVFVASKTKGKHTVDNVEYTYQDLEDLCFDSLLESIASHIESKITQETVDIDIAELRADIFGKDTDNEGVVKFKRTITIKASTDSSNYDVATVKYKYEAIGDGVYERMLSNGNLATVNLSTSAWSISPAETKIYTNNNSKTKGGQLERIYFYYYPAYNSGLYTANPCFEDKIIIDTESFKTSAGAPKNLDVYLIKQKPPMANIVALELAEDANKNYVEVKTAINGSAVGAVNLYHNFNDNIGDGTQRDLKWPQSGTFNELVVKSGCVCNDKAGLVETEQKELMYTINVTMYNNPIVTNNGSVQMTGDLILTLDGTKINW